MIGLTNGKLVLILTLMNRLKRYFLAQKLAKWTIHHYFLINTYLYHIKLKKILECIERKMHYPFKWIQLIE